MIRVGISHETWLERRKSRKRAKRLAAAVAVTLTLADVISVTEATIRTAVHDDTFVPSDQRQSQKLVERLLAAGERLSYDGLSDGARPSVPMIVRHRPPLQLL